MWISSFPLHFLIYFLPLGAEKAGLSEREVGLAVMEAEGVLVIIQPDCIISKPCTYNVLSTTYRSSMTVIGGVYELIALFYPYS